MLTYSPAQMTAKAARATQVTAFGKFAGLKEQKKVASKTTMIKASSPTEAPTQNISFGSLGFTNGNERFVGRLAMLGFASALIGEVLTGKGAIAQFGIETGLPTGEIPYLVIGLAAFNLLAAFLPNSATFAS